MFWIQSGIVKMLNSLAQKISEGSEGLLYIFLA